MTTPDTVIIDNVPATSSDEPMHTLADDCPCNPTISQLPDETWLRQHNPWPHEFEPIDIAETPVGKPNSVTMRCKDCGHQRTVMTTKTPAQIHAEASANAT